jgi:hypothetical protein
LCVRITLGTRKSCILMTVESRGLKGRMGLLTARNLQVEFIFSNACISNAKNILISNYLRRDFLNHECEGSDTIFEK